MRHALDVRRHVDAQQVQQRRDQVDAAEQLVVDARCHRPVGGRTEEHCYARSGVVQRGFRAGERRAVICEEHHPGGGVKSGLSQRVQQPADCCVGRGDGPVEAGPILAHLGSIGQVVRQIDGRAVDRLVAFLRVGPVDFEEPGRQQEWSSGTNRGDLAQPPLGFIHHVLAVGVRHVKLVVSQPLRVGRLVLHTEKS